MEATVKIRNWIELPTLELIPILRQGAVLRLPYLESRLAEAQAQIKVFEDRYTTTFDELNAEGLPDDAAYEMHEDFIEWEYWTDVMRKTAAAIDNVEILRSSYSFKHGFPVSDLSRSFDHEDISFDSVSWKLDRVF